MRRARESGEEAAARTRTKNSTVDRALAQSPHKIGKMYAKYERTPYEISKGMKLSNKHAAADDVRRFVPKMKINGERIVAKRPPVMHNQVNAEVNELLDLTASPPSNKASEACLATHSTYNSTPFYTPPSEQAEQYLFLEIPFDTYHKGYVDRVKSVERSLEEGDGNPLGLQ